MIIERVKSKLQDDQRMLLMGYECDALLKNTGWPRSKARSILSYETCALSSSKSNLLLVMLEKIRAYSPSSLIFNFGLSQLNGAELEQLILFLADDRQMVKNIYLRELSVEGEHPCSLKRKIETRRYLGNEWPGYLRNDAECHELFKVIDHHAVAWHLFSCGQLDSVFKKAGFEVCVSKVCLLDKYKANEQMIGRRINEVFLQK